MTLATRFAARGLKQNICGEDDSIDQVDSIRNRQLQGNYVFLF
jgi:hypothetical protein